MMLDTPFGFSLIVLSFLSSSNQFRTYDMK